MDNPAKKSVDDWLNSVDYRFHGYMPTEEALLFVAFIREVNGGAEENETPLVHLVMMDRVFNEDRRCAIMCARGLGKTSLFSEYLLLFIAAFGHLPGFGTVNLAMYVSDSIENGVKNLRRNIEHRYRESDFLRELIPDKKIGVGTNGAGYVGLDQYEHQISQGRKFTDVRLEFRNREGHVLVVKGYGSATGVRGVKELGQRPTLAILDDILSDTDAESPTVINTIENVVYKAVSKALHPKRQKMIWLGTPFSAKDPLYKAVESGAWKVAVFPLCERFPCPEEEFRGAWEDRFPYAYVKAEYEEAVAVGRPENFYQELQLRILADEMRLVEEADIQWYRKATLLKHKDAHHFYITTDFAVAGEEGNDFSVISVWAVNGKGWWFWVDGICKKQLMGDNVKDLFRLARIWKPLSVGIEVSGQQQGFVSLIEERMMEWQVFFHLASDNNKKKPGIRPSTNKLVRFQSVLPRFKQKAVFFPVEMKHTPEMVEAMEELTLATRGGFKSRHDDFIDTISMMGVMEIFRPGETELPAAPGTDEVWDIDFDEKQCSALSSYIV